MIAAFRLLFAINIHRSSENAINAISGAYSRLENILISSMIIAAAEALRNCFDTYIFDRYEKEIKVIIITSTRTRKVILERSE